MRMWSVYVCVPKRDLVALLVSPEGLLQSRHILTPRAGFTEEFSYTPHTSFSEEFSYTPHTSFSEEFSYTPHTSFREEFPLHSRCQF